MQINELRQQGFSFRKIAMELGLGEGTVRRAFHAHEDRAAMRQNPKAAASSLRAAE